MRALIVGAGPAAAGVALGLAKRHDIEIHVVDLGGGLEPELQGAKQRLGKASPDAWDRRDLDMISVTAVASGGHRLPEKRIFGSDFPFRDFGQLAGVVANDGINAHVISGAYGGFSNTWGAQTMPFSAATFRDWPISREDLEPDYRSVLGAIPYSAEEDDLSEYFPVLTSARKLPPLSDRSARVLEAYEANRVAVRRHGVILGKARLAFDGAECVRCGLCMTGCPYGLVYSASHTLDELRATGRIHYRGGLLALRVGEERGRPYVKVVSRDTGEEETLQADKLFLACGALGTTRLVAHSLEQWGTTIRVQESGQFLVPAASSSPVPRVAQEGTFTLNQFNAILPFDEEGHDVVQIHFYPYVRAVEQALPGFLHRTAFSRPRGELLKRLTVGLGYLPSWWSPGFEVSLNRPKTDKQLPSLALTAASSSASSKEKLRQAMRRLSHVAPHLDLYPIVPLASLSAAGKSYHFGGTCAPATGEGRTDLSTDVLGRVGAWRNIHLSDASVFPNVPATTFTLTIMANAHRIARTVSGSDGA